MVSSEIRIYNSNYDAKMSSSPIAHANAANDNGKFLLNADCIVVSTAVLSTL